MTKVYFCLLAGLLGLSVSAQELSPGTNAPPVPYLSPGEWWAVTNGMAPGDLAGLANLTTQGGALSPAALAAVKAGLTADDVSAIAAMAAQVLAVQAQSALFAQPLTQVSGGVTVANHVLNVNLGGQTSDKVGLAAIGQGASDLWTGSYFPYQYLSTNSNLPWSDNTASGISLVIANAPGDWANGAIDPMLRTYTYSYSGAITLTLTNVPAGSYALYLYGPGPTTDDSIFSVTSPSNGLGTLSTGPNWQSSTWSNGAQYVVFPGLSVSTGQPVTVDVQVDSLNYALVSGLQLLPYSNAVPDLLHETMTNRVPFMGVPFVVTGVIEAEQFDQGGRGVGYQVNDTSNATTAYRVCNLCITTNNGDPMGGGFCVDKLRANEWLSYSIDVRVSQTYAIEPRVAGIGTNGTFSISFSTNGVTYVTTNLTVPTTSWTNLLAKNVPLQAGTNIMTVTMLTNGVIGGGSSGEVARLNYISIYPSWIEGVTNAGPTNYVASLVANASDWATASNNSVAIQNAINSLTSGGTVSLTQTGRFYLASRLIPNEYMPEYSNSALYVYTNNLRIEGAGKDQTTLVAHDRGTTILYVGYRYQPTNLVSGVAEAPVTNFTLSGLSLEGNPHLVYTSTNSARAVWEDGWMSNSVYNINGTLLIVGSHSPPGTWVNNGLVTNCVFRNPSYVAIGLPDNVSNFMCRSNDFRFRDGTNGAYFGDVTYTNSANTTTNPWGGNLGIWAEAAQYGVDNLTVMECTFNGNVTNTSTNATSPVGGELR